MKKIGIPAVGIALYVIVTMIDVFLISLPMSMYIAALVIGSALIMTAFFDKLPRFPLFDSIGTHHGKSVRSI